MSRRLIPSLLGLVIGCAPAAPPSAPPAGTEFASCGVQPRGPFGVAPVRSLYVPTRDGVRLAVDLILPDSVPPDGVPTIMVMTRYWRAVEGQPATDLQRFWASHGYGVVWGDVRGTGASFGVWPHHRTRDETLDFSDVMDWIVAQGWSNGRIGAWGSSYTANTADWMAERNHPALKAVVSRFPDYDPYADLYFPGGVPNAYMGKNWGASVKQMDLNTPRTGEDGVARGVRPVDEDTDSALLRAAVDGRRAVPDMYQSMRTIVYKDDAPAAWNGTSMDWWGIHSHAADVERSGVPIQSWASWTDAGTANGVLHRLMRLANPQNVVIGAWSHGGVTDTDPFQPAEVESDPSSPSQFLDDLCFFDRFVKGVENGFAMGRLRYFTMGERRWKTAATWPLPEARETTWYFGADGSLASEEPREAGADRYAVDFTHTTGTRNRWATNNGAGDVIYPDRADADRALLTYTSAPLTEPMEITGQPVVTVWISADRDDAAVFAYLEDVAPDGRVTYLGEGQLRALHRAVSNAAPPYPVVGPYHSFFRADGAPLAPGTETELAFALHPLSVRIGAGHRLRVAVAGGDQDTFARVPSEGPLEIMVHRGGERRSRIVLPVVPAR
ncbi:MAG: CocE/NonD family hydrolase [Gemmatimonadales bacterium]